MKISAVGRNGQEIWSEDGGRSRAFLPSVLRLGLHLSLKREAEWSTSLL